MCAARHHRCFGKRYVRKDGTPIWALDNLSPIHDAQGVSRNAIIVTHDIHERKISEEALSLSEARFSQLSESDLLSIAFFTEEGTVIECSDAFLTLTGYSRAQMNEKQISLHALTPPEWLFRTHEATEELKERIR